MNLDLRTMIVMLAALSFLFSILLGLAGLHTRGIRGLGHWALASLLISLGFAIAYKHLTPSNGWHIVAGASLVAAGSALQWLGIQAFKEQACRWRLPSLAVALVTAQSLWFSVIDPDVNMRAMANSIVFATISFACAKALLIPIRSPERTAHWLTGASFALLAAMHAARALTIFLHPADNYGLYSQIPINPLIFFTGTVTHLFITFGFILMVNYRLSAELDDLATTDPLTGAWNRRSLELEFNRLLARCLRRRETLSVMMLDVDCFKSINDDYGHQAGDEVLRHLIANAKAEIRGDDYLARYGGEEFCLLLPSASAEEAGNLAERLRQSHAEKPVPWHGKTIASSISIGVASSQQTGLNYSALLDAADAALYQAKQAGRDKVVVHSTISPPKTLMKK